ncbi:MAG TPA: PRC-barrel domain-containing protein [Solirubrobacteraceae bacterium]|nr:PRC-barrel domain-containing protein [Solirubrobacteraceae bacterium]
MTDLGEPGSYLTLADGVPVLTSDGEEIGHVTHVLADADEDIFEGFVMRHRLGHRFVDASQIAQIHERGVVLSIDAGAAAALPEPTAAPGAIELGADDLVKDEMKDRLHRAWRMISGR